MQIKKITAIVLSIIFVLGCFPMSAFAAGTQTNPYVAQGQYVYKLSADAPTSDPPEGFGTKEFNGKMWTDKSVNVGNSEFEVTLSALAQQYVKTNIVEDENSIPADVLMILDFSGSMENPVDSEDNNSPRRSRALVMAVNQAMDIVMGANPNNKIAVYGFVGSNGSANSAQQLLAFDHYSNSSWTADSPWNDATGAGKYFNYIAPSGSTKSKMKTAAGITGTAGAPSSVEKSFSGGTDTQVATVKCIDEFITQINNNNDGIEHAPYVMFMTDGHPAGYSTYWYVNNLTSTVKVGSKNRKFSDGYTYTDSGSNEITALNVLAAAYQKDRLEAAYTAHNRAATGDDELETDVKWWTVGLSIKEGDAEKETCFLDPTLIKDLPNGTSSNKSVKQYLETYAANYTGKNYSLPENYDYSDHSVYATAADKLTSVFNAFALEIANASVSYPISVHEQTGSTNVSDVVFKDVLGAHTEITGIKLLPNNIKTPDVSSYVTGEFNEETGVYRFKKDASHYYDTTVTLSKESGSQVLTWYIPAHELAMYTFKRSTTQFENNHFEYNSCSPTRLVYTVNLDKDIDGSVTYSNANANGVAETTASFSVPGDNYYYFNNVELDPGEGNEISYAMYAGSSLRDDLNEDRQKTANSTGTAAYVSDYTYTVQDEGELTASADVTVRLGNNGKASPQLKIKKTVDNPEPFPGDEVTYTIKVTNISDTTITDIDISDVNPITDEDISYTITSLASGASDTKTYTEETPDVPKGTEYPSVIPTVSQIGSTDIPDPIVPESSEADVTVQGLNAVIYSWTTVPSGKTLPASVTLPTDSNTYGEDAAYTVDSTYTDQSKVPVYKAGTTDVVEGTWSFSGWTDPNNGVMGEEDITITGVWTYETAETYGVTYSWGNYTPDGYSLPTDSTEYYANETVTAKYDTITKNTSVEIKDGNNNVIATYTFTGWDADSKAVNDDDVTFTAQWDYSAAPTYTVTYEYEGDTPDGAVPPTDDNTYYINNNVTIINPANTTVFDSEDNKWTFDGWDREENKPITGNTVIKGTWTKETPKTVTYNWGTEAPASVTKPSDDDPHYKNETVTAETVTAEPVYDDEGNKWTFSGWDEDEKTVGDDNIVFSGSWDKETPKTVTYDWGQSVPASVTKPTDNNYHYDGETITAEVVYPDPVYDDEGNKWTFSGWDEAQKTVDGENVVFTGSWTEEFPKSVSYRLTGNVPESAAAPTDAKSYFKDDTYTLKPGFETVLVKDEYQNIIGKYTFDGWADPNNGVMGESDVEITGNWKYTPIELSEQSVIYSWTGDIPEGVILPEDSNKYVNGQSYAVDTSYTSSTIILVRDQYNNIIGDYTFSGWTDPDNGVMGEEDVTVTGIWEYSTVTLTPYRVIYSWTGDVPASESDKNTYNFDTNEYVNNQPYEIETTYTKNTVKYENDKKYTFSGWDKENGRIDYANVDVRGVWTAENAKHLTYIMTGIVPDGINEPADGTNYFSGDTYELDTTFPNGKVIKSYDDYGNVNGEYIFGGWTDNNNGVFSDSNLTVYGNWTFRSIEVPQHSVTYNWGTVVPEGVTLPVDQDTYVNGQEYKVDDEYTINSKIYTKDQFNNINGVYEFSGWSDPGEGLMGETDVEVTGKWTYRNIPVDKYHVFYFWTGDVPAGAVLPVDGYDYVNNESYTIDGVYTDESILKNGSAKYTFSGWNKTSGTINGENVNVNGVWTAEQAKTITYNFIGDVPPGKDEPVDNTYYFNGDRYSIDNTFKSGDTVNTYDKYGNVDGRYEFKGWNDTSDRTVGDENIAITGIWKLTPVPVPAHGVVYNWGTTVPDGVILPVDNNAYVKGQEYPTDESYVRGTTVPVKDQYGNITGKYTFSGWTDPNEGIMGDDAAEITGSWSYSDVEVPVYKITYIWTGNIPASMEDRLPSDGTLYVPSQPYTVNKELNKNTVIIENGKKYTFSGWDLADGIFVDSDLAANGIWTAENAKRITYEWGDFDPSVDVPEDENDYYNGDIITPPGIIEPGTVFEIKDEYGNTVDEYRFDDWNIPNGGVVEDKEVTGTAVWTHIPVEVPTYTVRYDWGTDAPATVSVPVDGTAYVNNQPYTVDLRYTRGTKIVDYNKDHESVGYWEFSGWDRESGIISGKDDLINGIWTYADTSDRIIRYRSSDDGRSEDKVTDQTVIRIDPNDGKWRDSNNIVHTELTEVTVTKDLTIASSERTGYVFDGWYKSVDPDGCARYTARWTEKKAADVSPVGIKRLIGSIVKPGPSGPSYLEQYGINTNTVRSDIFVPKFEIHSKDKSPDAAHENSISENSGSEKIPYTGGEVAIAPFILFLVSAAGIVLAAKKEKDEAEND